MSELPTGWVRATVEELAGANGLVTDGDWIESKDQDPNGDVRLVQLADIGDGNFRDRSSRFLTSKRAAELACTFLERGDVLVARMPDPLGRACIFPGDAQKAVTAVDVLVWRGARDEVSNRWLMHFINSPEVRQTILDSASGTTRQRISGGRLKALALPVPPAAEQRRIVAKIDSLSSMSKRAREQLDHIPRLVGKYKQAVLARIFCDASMEGWTKELVGDVVADELVGLVRSKIEQRPIGVPYIRMGHFDMEGNWNDRDLTFVQTSKEELERYELRDGDVLFNTRNSRELVGKVAIWPSNKRGCVYNNNLLRLRFEDVVIPSFARWLMVSPWFRSYLETVKSATTSVCAVYQRSLMAGPFAYPSLKDQQAIVRRIERAFSWIDRLAAEADSARKLIGRLDQAVLGRALKGKLVPQDPRDEPASMLIDSIKTQRGLPQSKSRGG